MMDDYGRFQPRTHQRINQLQTRLRTLDLPPTSEAHIHDALGVMLDAHCEQKGRQSGEDYAQHPLEVALHVIEQFGATSPEVIIAALLHDTVEDQARKLVAMRGDDRPGMKRAEPAGRDDRRPSPGRRRHAEERHSCPRSGAHGERGPWR